MERHHLYRFGLATGVLGLGFSLGSHSVFGQQDVGTLRVAIHDKASGEVVPAMVCITSLADNTWRVPPDGRTAAPFLRNVDFIAGRWKSIEYVGGTWRKWFPGDPGPPPGYHERYLSG